MRTTVTLDPDVEALIRKRMTERGLSFKEALNSAIRDGLSGERPEPFTTPTYSMGKPAVPLDHALRLAAELDDAEIRRELNVGS